MVIGNPTWTEESAIHGELSGREVGGGGVGMRWEEGEVCWSLPQTWLRNQRGGVVRKEVVLNQPPPKEPQTLK